MKVQMIATPVILLCLCESAIACGGGDGGSGKGFLSSKGRGEGISVASGHSFSPINRMAMVNSQFNQAKQASIAQANAYNARMKPIRIANAMRVRETKIARREARKTIMLAKLEAKKQSQQEEREFLVKARKWTDSTGTHSVVAILADANAWGVQLVKQDGKSINVPMHRLSSPDRSWVNSQMKPSAEENRLMLAGL